MVLLEAFDTFRVRISNVSCRALKRSGKEGGKKGKKTKNEDSDDMDPLAWRKRYRAHDDSPSEPISAQVRFNFDNFKHGKSDVDALGGRNPAWPTFEQSFFFETQYAHKLSKKVFVMSVWHKETKFKIRHKSVFIGSCAVDLYTLATGPLAHTLRLRTDTGKVVGEISFEVRMEHVARIEIALKNVEASQMTSLLRDKRGEIVPMYLKATYTNDRDAAPNDILSVSVNAKGHNDPSPEWREMETLDFHATIREMYNYRLRLSVKQGKYDYAGVADLDFRDLYWPGKEKLVDFDEKLVAFEHQKKKLQKLESGGVAAASDSSDGNNNSPTLSRQTSTGDVVTGRIRGQIFIRGGPRFYPMIGGRNRDRGVIGGRTWSDRLPTPNRWLQGEDRHSQALKALKVAQARRDLAQKKRASGDTHTRTGGRRTRRTTTGLAPGWERRITPLGQVYYVNHDTQATQWEEPLAPSTAGSVTVALEDSDSGSDINSDDSSDRDSDTDDTDLADSEELDYAAFSKHSAQFAKTLTNPTAIADRAAKLETDTADAALYPSLTSDATTATTTTGAVSSSQTTTVPTYDESKSQQDAAQVLQKAVRKMISARAMETARRQQLQKQPLAPEWEVRFDQWGRQYFANSKTQTTQWVDPRLEAAAGVGAVSDTAPEISLDDTRSSRRSVLAPHLSTIPPDAQPPFEGVPQVEYGMAATNPFRLARQLSRSGSGIRELRRPRDENTSAVVAPPKEEEESRHGKGHDEVLEFSLGRSHAAAINGTGLLLAWGTIGHAQPILLPRVVPNMNRVRQVSCGGAHVLALGCQGRCWAFGDNTYGQLGFEGETKGEKGSFSQPVTVDALKGRNLLSVAAGGDHSIALTDRGNVFAWGRSEHGQLGSDRSATTTADQHTPALVQRFGDAADFTWEHVRIVTVVAGGCHTAALDQNGRVYHWGGGSSEAAPVEAFDSKNVVQLALSASRMCVLTAKGRVFTSFLSTSETALSQSAGERPFSKPLVVPELKGYQIVSVSAGEKLCAAVVADGSIAVWAVGFGIDRDQAEKQGRGVRWVRSLAENEDESVNLQRVECGADFCGVLSTGGDLYMFGSGGTGALGLGDAHDRRIPRFVPMDAKHQSWQDNPV
jgi:alpha-tubulin suppressor-like RCC1 family protein